MDDPELLTAWRGGNNAAGEQLFARYYGMVSRFFANKVCGDPADLIQGTFEACVLGHQQIRDTAQFRSFLFGIAYNVLRGHYRTQRAHDDRFDPSTSSSADLSPGVGTMLARGDEQQLLLAALRQLPLEHQVVIELFYWEDLTSAEIAEMLAEPHGTVRTRLRRARQLLEQALADLTPDAALLHRTTTDLDGWAKKVREAAREAAE